MRLTFTAFLITALTASATWAQNETAPATPEPPAAPGPATTPPASPTPPPKPEPPSRAYHYLWLQDPWTGETKLSVVREPSMELWNAARVDDYADAIEVEASPALAVLSIDRLDIQVPVYNGTDEFNLNRGLGRIRGMARLHEDGNLGISGHRDGFFRALKDIQNGDEIIVKTTEGTDKYQVSGITIVDKHDETPLSPTEDRQLTLVTCYPFYFVGNAPKRMIIVADPVEQTPVDEASNIL